MNPDRAVEAAGLTRCYGSREALSDVSFAVERGEIFGLLGPNGGGKTTLFRILSTLLAPHHGSANVLGFDVVRQAQEVRRRIGVVFQAPNVDRKLTAAENLHYQGLLYGLHGKPLQNRIDDLLRSFGLADRKMERMETFSGGQRRRVELAKGLLHRPPLLLLDEPSTGLDPGVRRDLWQTLRMVRAGDRVTILLTTHLLEEAEHCDRLAILDRGKLVACDTPAALKREVGGEVILVETPQPEALRDGLRQRFQVDPTLFDDQLRFEHPRGHAVIPELVEAFPGQIQSVRVSQPTLEDVFFRRTGHAFSDRASLNGLRP
jgi:ABC-2 type transport system ATP-binding protein